MLSGQVYLPTLLCRPCQCLVMWVSVLSSSANTALYVPNLEETGGISIGTAQHQHRVQVPFWDFRQNQRKWCVKAPHFCSCLVRHAPCLVLSCRWPCGRLCCILWVESLVLVRRNSHVSICSCGRPQPEHPGWPGKTGKKPTRLPLYPCLSNLLKCTSVPTG